MALVLLLLAWYAVARAPFAQPNSMATGIVESTSRAVGGGKRRLVETDLELIRQAQDGDRQAFGQLVRRHHQGVIDVVYRLCGNIDVAEEAAQETFIRAWSHLPRYKPRSPFRNWLYRIGINVARDALRRERPTVDIASLPVASGERGPQSVVEATERGEIVRQAVMDLPPASKEVIVLREYGGLSYKEIAETLGIPIGTVMSRLNYARGLLRQTLEPYLEVL
jgi:RNA polymerase sigma-70 factor (ECF subfamily)